MSEPTITKKKSSNANLNKANKEKNDEFYTQLTDIEKELGHYKEHFKDKVIFCNCDDPEESHFWKYFEMNFEYLGIRKLVSTHFEIDKPSYKLEIIGDRNHNGKINSCDIVKTLLNQNGDFRSPECIEILKESDIVVTNPPFSLFREYVAQLFEYEKKFIIVGNQNAVVNDKHIFKFVLKNKLWLGYTCPKDFIQPDRSIKKFGNIAWLTNFETKKRHENLILYKTYLENEYLKYDNYDAINVDKTKDIPMNYEGIMGVPITFLNKYNPDQFEIIGATNNKHIDCISFTSYVNQKKTYARLLIKHKKL